MLARELKLTTSRGSFAATAKCGLSAASADRGSCHRILKTVAAARLSHRSRKEERTVRSSSGPLQLHLSTRPQLTSWIVRDAIVVTGVVALSVGAASGQTSNPHAPHLELREIGSVPLPASLAVLGGLIAASGSIVFWTPSQVWQIEKIGRA